MAASTRLLWHVARLHAFDRIMPAMGNSMRFWRKIANPEPGESVAEQQDELVCGDVHGNHRLLVEDWLLAAQGWSQATSLGTRLVSAHISDRRFGLGLRNISELWTVVYA
jgi:hypothetical protein